MAGWPEAKTDANHLGEPDLQPNVHGVIGHVTLAG